MPDIGICRVYVPPLYRVETKRNTIKLLVVKRHMKYSNKSDVIIILNCGQLSVT